MEFWNNASTGMKILIVVVIAAAVIALFYIVANAFGGAEKPTAPIAPVATEAPQPTETPEAPPPTESPSDPEALEGREWAVMSVLEDTEITAIFVRGKVSGSSGCNTYTGSYQTSSASAITISDLKGGRLTCDQPIMDQENNYLTVLGAASSFQVQGDQLVINTAMAPLQYLATGR